jgi:peptide/nickel transport system substrate-binding protein/oligopeptide transport system substrate-binding protein
VTSVGSLDPRALESPESLLLAAQVFDGLVSYEPAGSAVAPAVAERWDVLDGGARFVFHLRSGVTFHDGSPVTADTFVSSWTRLADPERVSPFAFLLESVDGFREFHMTREAQVLQGLSALDGRTFEVRLTRPWPDFVALLGHPTLSPVPSGADEPSFPALPIGNGPYRLERAVERGAPILLSRFDGYYGPKARVDNLEFRVHATSEEAWPDFLAGELDVSEVPSSALLDAQSEFGTRGVVTLGRVLYCGFNQAIRHLRNPRLRVAVSLAIDREALTRGVYGAVAEPSTGIVPPTIPGSQDDACAGACFTDLDRAGSIVEKLPEGSRSFDLDFRDSSIGARLAVAVAERLALAGLRVTPNAYEEDAFVRLFQRREHEFYCLVWVADFPRPQAFLEPLLLSTSPDNRTGFVDARLDRLLDRARGEEDPARREDLYRQAERRALELMPLVPLAWFHSRLAVKPYVQGFALDPSGTFDASSLSIQP